MRTMDETIAAYEAGETWNDDDEVVEIEVRRPLDKVIPVRLTSEQWAAVRREAAALGIGPSTLIRMWTLERLRHLAAGAPERGGAGEVLTRLTNAVVALGRVRLHSSNAPPSR
jgi:hypothetical protein